MPKPFFPLLKARRAPALSPVIATLSNGQTVRVEIKRDRSSSIMFDRIKEAVKLAGYRRKVVSWDWEDYEKEFATVPGTDEKGHRCTLKSGDRFRDDKGDVYILECLPYSAAWVLTCTKGDRTTQWMAVVRGFPLDAFGGHRAKFTKL